MILANWVRLKLTYIPYQWLIVPGLAPVLLNLSEPAISIHLKLLIRTLSPIFSYILSSISKWLLLEVRFILVLQVSLFLLIIAHYSSNYSFDVTMYSLIPYNSFVLGWILIRISVIMSLMMHCSATFGSMPFSQIYTVRIAFFDEAMSKTASAILGNNPF